MDEVVDQLAISEYVAAVASGFRDSVSECVLFIVGLLPGVRHLLVCCLKDVVRQVSFDQLVDQVRPGASEGTCFGANSG